LCEAKREGVLFGESRLLAETEALGHLAPREQIEPPYSSVVEYAGGGLVDDLAVLALRLAPGESG